MCSLEIRMMPIAELRPAPFNPRRELPPAAYRKLKASLVEFGLVEPIVWNELTGHVVGGHARLAILKELGVAEAPMSVVRLSDARERALTVVLNNPEAQGRYDPAKLAELLEGLKDLPEFDLTGFDRRVFSTLALRPAEVAENAADADRVEITLATDAATYERLAPELDALVARYDLVAHVSRSGR